MTLGVRYLCLETSLHTPAEQLTDHERYEELSIYIKPNYHSCI